MSSEKKYPSSQLDQYMVRFPEGMRDELKAAAAAFNRSLNAEIIARLEQYKKWLPIAAGHNYLRAEVERLTAENAEFVEALKRNMDTHIPQGLHERIAAKAAENGRSVNEEVVQALEKAFPVPATTDDIIRLLSEMFQMSDARRPNTASAEIDSDPATARLRLYLAYLIQERDAGRGEEARKAPVTLDLERMADGTIRPIQDGAD